MPTWLEKTLWSAVAGTAIGLGGCGNNNTHGTPDDAQAEEDALDAQDEQEPEDAVDMAGDPSAEAEDPVEEAAEDPTGDPVDDPTDDPVDDPAEDLVADAADVVEVTDTVDVVTDLDEEELGLLYGPPVA